MESDNFIQIAKEVIDKAILPTNTLMNKIK